MGISVKLPLSRDPNDGIALNKTLIEVSRQNFINLLLTNPGERIMIPEFGVGLSTFLFEQDTDVLREEIDSRIRGQVSLYLPYIRIRRIDFNTNGRNPQVSSNDLSLFVEFEILPLNFIENLAISPDFEQNIVNIQSLTNTELLPF